MRAGPSGRHREALIERRRKADELAAQGAGRCSGAQGGEGIGAETRPGALRKHAEGHRSCSGDAHDAHGEDVEMRGFHCLGLLAVTLSVVGCGPQLDLRGYPLYPDVGRRLTGDEVARLYGPMAQVDDRDVSKLGDALELASGCHRVQTRDDPVPGFFGRSGAGRGIRFGARSFVLSMTGGHAYVLKRWASTGGMSVFIEEHDATGAVSRYIDSGKGDTAICGMCTFRSGWCRGGDY
jgi:hypothetical protein